MDILHWDLILIIILVVTFAGFIQGLVGFGSGLVMVPILVIIIEPKVLVPAVLINGLVMNGILTIEARKGIQIRRISPILFGALLGLPLGALLLLVLPGDLMKVFIGSVIILFGSILLSGKSFKFQRERILSIPIGFMSGLLNGSISMSGPPVILFFANQGVEKRNFRANLVTYFFLLNIVTLIVFTVLGLIDTDVIILFAISLPASLVGIFIGTRFSKILKERMFRRIALVIVIAAGVLSLVMGVTALT